MALVRAENGPTVQDNQIQEVVTLPEAETDPEQLALEMRAKGMTREDLIGAKQRLDAAGVVQGAPMQKSFSQTLQAFDKTSDELGYLFGTKPAVDLDLMFSASDSPFQMSLPALKENSLMAASALNITPEEAEKLIGDGEELLPEAYAAIRSNYVMEFQQETEQRIRDAETPEQTLRALQDLGEAQDRPLTPVDFRDAYIKDVITAQNYEANYKFDFSSARGHIHQNLVIAEEIGKASERVWEQAEYGDLFKDLGQLLIPFTGYAEEEINKWSVDTAQILRDLKQAGSRAEAKDKIDLLVQALKDTQTPLIERNNTLLTLQSLNSIANEFRDGAYGWVDGIVTEEDVRKGVETAAFGALEFIPAAGSLDGAIKAISKRILPRNSIDTSGFVPMVDQKNIAQFSVQSPDVSNVVLTQRAGSSSMDTIVQVDPTPIRKEIVSEGVAETAKKHNLTPEQASDRSMPTLGAYIAKTIPNTELSRAELNELNLSNIDINSMKTQQALDLQKDIGESGTVQISDVVIVPNEDTSSIGEFVFHVGSSKGNWFDSLDQAEAVQQRIFGQDTEVVELNGKYAVRVSHNHIFNPKKDVKEEAVQTVTGKLRMVADVLYSLGVLDPLRVLQEDFMSAVSSVSDVNRATLGKLAADFNTATKSWTNKSKLQLARVLQEADSMGANGQILTKQDMLSVLPSASQKQIDNIWERYAQVREISEELYKITDKRFRIQLESQGWKFSKFGDDSDFVRKARSAEMSPDELVLDTRTNTVVRQGDLELDETVTLGKVMNPRVGPDKKDYDLIVVKNSDTQALPLGPLLNKQEGYVPRYYTDTGWILKRAGTRNINGVNKPVSNVTHIVRSKADAKKAKQAAINREVREFRATLRGLTPEEQALKLEQKTAQLQKEITWHRSRENSERDLIWGKDSDVSFGFGSVNSRAKGERLSGSEGPAPILDPVSSIARRINSISRDLNHPVIASMQSRFNQRYSSFLREGEGTAWNPSLSAMLKKEDSLTVEARMEMGSMHSYIESLREVETAPLFGRIDAMFESLFEGIPVLEKVANPLKNTAQWLKFNAALVFIIGRPNFQIPTNLFQMWPIAIRSLAYSPFQVLRGSASVPFVLAGRINKMENPKVISKMLGVPESEAKPLMKFLFEDSGLVRDTDFTDDILSSATDELIKTQGHGVLSTGKRVVTAPVRGAFAASTALQTKSLQMVNLYAFLTEVTREAAKGGFKLDARTKAKLLFNTRKLTQTQNRSNQFRYQNSADIDGLMFQFMQHVQKMMLDLVIEPTTTALTGKTFKRNPFAEDRKVAAALTAGNLILFGTSGIIGSKLSREGGNELIEEFPEIATDPAFQEVYETATGGIINSMVSGFSDRITPAAYTDSIHQLFANDDGLLGTMFGASGAYTSSVYDLGKNLITLSFTPDMSAEDKFYPALREISALFSGARDIEKAYIAYNFGVLPYSSNLSGAMAVSNREAIAAAFSVTPEAINDFYNESGKRGRVQGSLTLTNSQKRINDLFIRQMNRELIELSELKGYDYLRKAIPIRQKWIGYAKAAHGLDNITMNKVENYFMTKTLSPNSEDFEKFVRPYIYDLDIEETIENLERIGNTTDNPKLAEFVKNRVQMMRMVQD